jgi:riboflavin synthase
MFTGIIETIGVVKECWQNGSNKSFWIESAISNELNIDQSVAHDGVCLTVEEIKGNLHRVTAINETLTKTSLNTWQTGKEINLERCIQLSARLDGHIVQGHIDTTANCISKIEKEGSWVYQFQFAPNHKFESLIVEKGSIAINGISLTLFDVDRNFFKVAIIPYTYTNTTIKEIIPGSITNIEFDIIGKYVLRSQQVLT